MPSCPVPREKVRENPNSGRIEFLDGLRGVAIVMVVLFHAYARWTDLLPFRDQFSGVAVFVNGWLGVQLFFMISGFVIVMTLGRCKSYFEFLLRRWFRLFPAMLVCSIIVFLTAPAFPERPAGTPSLRDLIPGLTFIDPVIWKKLFGGEQYVLEASFWSLFVEVQFYVIFGALYFIAGRFLAIAGIFTIFLINCTGFLHGIPYLAKIGAQHYGWFTTGVLFYQYFSVRHRIWLYAAIFCGLISAHSVTDFDVHGHYGITITAFSVFAIFTGSFFWVSVRELLCARILVFMGFISYPLYLLHENMMVSMIIKLGAWMPWMPAIALPVLPVLAVIALSWVIASRVETKLRTALQSSYKRCRQMIAANP